MFTTIDEDTPSNAVCQNASDQGEKSVGQVHQVVQDSSSEENVHMETVSLKSKLISFETLIKYLSTEAEMQGTSSPKPERARKGRRFV